MDEKKILCSNSRHDPPCKEQVTQKGSILCEKCTLQQKSKSQEKRGKDYADLLEKHKLLQTSIENCKTELKAEKSLRQKFETDNVLLREFENVMEKNTVIFLNETERLKSEIEKLQDEKSQFQTNYDQLLLDNQKLMLTLARLTEEKSHFLQENLLLIEENKKFSELITQFSIEKIEKDEIIKKLQHSLATTSASGISPRRNTVTNSPMNSRPPTPPPSQKKHK